jgi:hypothetical protein
MDPSIDLKWAGEPFSESDNIVVSQPEKIRKINVIANARNPIAQPYY